MAFCRDIQGPQRMNPIDFGDSSGQNLNTMVDVDSSLVKQLLLEQHHDSPRTKFTEAAVHWHLMISV